MGWHSVDAHLQNTFHIAQLPLDRDKYQVSLFCIIFLDVTARKRILLISRKIQVRVFKYYYYINYYNINQEKLREFFFYYIIILIIIL